MAAGLAAFAALLTAMMLKVRILAIPNSRSSHQHKVTSSGGVAIVAATCLGVAFAYLAGPYFRSVETELLGLAIASLVIAGVGLIDDMGRIDGFRAKLGAQLFACGILLLSGFVIESITLPLIGSVTVGWWGYLLTGIWIIALTNIFNFMDGLDGLAAGTAVIVAASFGFVCLSQGTLFAHVLGFALAAASFGFLAFNFPKAMIFMGDVGSQFIGFVLAALAVLAAVHELSEVSVLVIPLLLFNFIFDTLFTFVRRWLAGEAVTQAHKSHLYQLLNQLGYSHARVSVFHFGVALSQAAGAVILASGVVVDPAWVFLPYLAFQGIYAALVLRATHLRESV